MVETTQTFDVFISHSAVDTKVAAEIANACRANGLDAVTYAELLPGADASDALWEALAESKALLAILSPSGPTPSMAIELGAARAWNKPIFGLVTDPSLVRLPSGLKGIRLYTPGKIEDVIRAVKLAGQELSDEDRSLLARTYADLGVSVDQLALDPRHLEGIVNRFSSGTGKVVSGEHLLSELFRMRKQGRLPKGRSADRSRPRGGTG